MHQNVKSISKVSSNLVKSLFLNLILSNQNAYVINRGQTNIWYFRADGYFEYGRLSFTTDIENAFDSIDQSFLLAIPEKYGF